MKQNHINFLKQLSNDDDLKYFIESLCTSRIKPKGYWNLERCKEDALKYNTRNEWRRNSCSAYGSALRNGCKDICCKHMKTQLTKTKE